MCIFCCFDFFQQKIESFVKNILIKNNLLYVDILELDGFTQHLIHNLIIENKLINYCFHDILI
jgi:hypothetical protein